MKLLLDTSTFLWITLESPQLSSTAKRLFLDNSNEAYLSVVSTWEIVVKHNLGRLPLPRPAALFVPQQRAAHGVSSLMLDENATLRLPQLPSLHQDPFDRMLICQAISQDMHLLTSDPMIHRYPNVRTIW